MNVCTECPVRLFNNKHYNLQGIGNPAFGRVIVVPNVDYNAYKKGNMGFSEQVKLIEDVLHSSTGELDILNQLYIVPFIRCNETISCEINDDIYKRCITHFATDIRLYNFKYIMLLGNAARKFLNCDIKSQLGIHIISPNNRIYSVNYSPLVKYTNEELFEIFKHYLISWYYNTI